MLEARRVVISHMVISKPELARINNARTSPHVWHFSRRPVSKTGRLGLSQIVSIRSLTKGPCSFAGTGIQTDVSTGNRTKSISCNI